MPLVSDILSSQRVLTDANMLDPEISKFIEGCMKSIFQCVNVVGVILPSDAELVLELVERDDKETPRLCGYYFM